MRVFLAHHPPNPRPRPLGFFTGHTLPQPPPAFPLSDASAQRPRSGLGARGFTLIELVAVMLIAGLMASFAASRFFQRATFDARSFSDQVSNIVRYGQKLAVAQNRPVFVRINADSVALCFDAACGAANRVVPPAGSNSGSKETLQYCEGLRNWLCEGRPAGVTLDINPVNMSLFYFDALGKPHAASNVFPAASTFPARLALRVQGDGVPRTISVEGETGYVY